MVWEFRDYLDMGGTNAIRAWLDSIPTQAMLKIDNRLLHLRAVEVWPPQYVSAIRGCSHLFEMRIVFGGNQYRPIGFFGPSKRQFTFVLGVIEKRRLPNNILETAQNRRQIVIDDGRRSEEHVYRTLRPGGESKR